MHLFMEMGSRRQSINLVEEHGLTYKLEDDAWRYMIDRNIGFFPRKEAIALNWSTDTISLKSKRK
jgi:hypothetical protein